MVGGTPDTFREPSGIPPRPPAILASGGLGLLRGVGSREGGPRAGELAGRRDMDGICAVTKGALIMRC